MATVPLVPNPTNATCLVNATPLHDRHPSCADSIIAFHPFPGSTWSLPRHSNQTYRGVSDASSEDNMADDDSDRDEEDED